MALLVIGLNILLLHFKETQVEKTVEVLKNEKSTFNDFISKYSKIILFCIVPIFSLNAKLIFKRLKLNIAEHFILGGITLLGLLISSSVLFVFSILDLNFDIIIFGISKMIIALFIFLFPGWSYFNATKNLYKTWGFSWRIFCFYLLTIVEFILLLAFITAIILKDVNAPLEIHI